MLSHKLRQIALMMMTCASACVNSGGSSAPLDLCAISRLYPVVVRADIASYEAAGPDLWAKANAGGELSKLKLANVEWLRVDDRVIDAGDVVIELAIATSPSLVKSRLVDASGGGRSVLIPVRKDGELVGTCPTCVFWEDDRTGLLHNAGLYSKDGLTETDVNSVLIQKFDPANCGGVPSGAGGDERSSDAVDAGLDVLPDAGP